jgi:putative acetyltransferase
MRISEDDPHRADIGALVDEHLADMRAWSPPCSVHAFDIDGLVAPGMTFWTARADDGTLLGMAAMKDLGEAGGELKSMRATRAARGTGVGRALLDHAIAVARSRGWRALWLETGSQEQFVPARTLYASRGFVECGPFVGYVEDPASTFMRLDLAVVD